jgi:ParB/Sulfiredoxin domain
MTDPIPFHLAPQEYDPAIPVTTLREHPKNYNLGDTEAIAESLDAHGFYGAVIAQKSTGLIVAGNHRYRIARDKGAPTIPGFWLDCDDDEAERILSHDNLTSKLAKVDEERLIALLTGVRDRTGSLYGTGHDETALALLIRHHAGVTAQPTDPNSEWEGMPDFDQPGQPPAYSVVMHFPTEAAADEFFTLIQRDRPKQRFLWWPHHDGFKGMDYSQAEVLGDPAG